jgi:alpha-ketoglutarate-dependent taurine dioxygenase
MMNRTGRLDHNCGAILNLKRGELGSLSSELLMELLGQHGAVLIKGANASVDEFAKLAELLTTDFSSYKGGAQSYGPMSREKINNQDTLLTTSGSKHGFSIPLHGEMYYLKSPPELMWFFCQNPPADGGGQTTLGNAAEAYRKLPAKTVKFFDENRIRYMRRLGPDEWQGCFQTESIEEVRKFCELEGSTFKQEDDGSVSSDFVTSVFRSKGDGGERLFINNMLVFLKGEEAFLKNYGEDRPSVLRVRLESGDAIPRDIVEDVQSAMEAITYNIEWEKGEMVVLDNRWILHGRRKAKQNSGRQIFMRMGKSRFAATNSGAR